MTKDQALLLADKLLALINAQPSTPSRDAMADVILAGIVPREIAASRKVDIYRDADIAKEMEEEAAVEAARKRYARAIHPCTKEDMQAIARRVMAASPHNYRKGDKLYLPNGLECLTILSDDPDQKRVIVECWKDQWAPLLWSHYWNKG